MSKGSAAAAADSDAERKLKASYEGKLATLAAINSALQAENEKLRNTLEESQTPSTATEAEISELQEEFSRRLAVAERQATAAQDERDDMRAQLRSATRGGSVNEAKLKEKDDYIAALQKEGERLSKKNGELEAAARRVRAQLRDLEADRDRLTSQLLKAESRASTAEQESVEIQEEWKAAQEEADLEIEQVLKEADAKVAAAKNEAGKMLQQSQKEQQKEASEALAAALEREAAMTQALNETRFAMEEAASIAADREYQLRNEAALLERRLRELEAANHALQIGGSGDGDGGAGVAAAAGSSLLRQLESITAASVVQQQAAFETENRLAAQVAELRSQVSAALSAEKEATSTINILQEEIIAVKQGHDSSKTALLQTQEDLMVHQQRCNDLKNELAQAQATLAEVGFSLERHTSANTAERQKLQESLWEAEEALRTEVSERKELEKQLLQKGVEVEAAAAATILSPISGDGGNRDSQAAAAAAAVKIKEKEEELIEDEMDVVVRSMGIGSTSTSSAINSDPRQQRVHMLQQQLRLAESARDASTEQLIIALEAAEKSRIAAQHAATLEKQLTLVTKKLDIALEVLGEKNERVEVLEEDIRDMKAIFHEQLAVAADQLADARAQLLIKN
ncbi:hypothetical protein Ndes2526A_g02383 [Nannochloris sp. 'desiccata']